MELLLLSFRYIIYGQAPLMNPCLGTKPLEAIFFSSFSQVWLLFNHDNAAQKRVVGQTRPSSRMPLINHGDLVMNFWHDCGRSKLRSGGRSVGLADSASLATEQDNRLRLFDRFMRRSYDRTVGALCFCALGSVGENQRL